MADKVHHTTFTHGHPSPWYHRRLVPPWTGSCGYPQGDSMSIFAMTIITEAWRICVAAQCSRDLGPTGRLMSFAIGKQLLAQRKVPSTSSVPRSPSSNALACPPATISVGPGAPKQGEGNCLEIELRRFWPYGASRGPRTSAAVCRTPKCATHTRVKPEVPRCKAL